ncbi:MAG: 3-hydroxyacyl-CoA dehydrogenase NAD-binding domain-containing protein, partial [Gemmatimonadota bacterium]
MTASSPTAAAGAGSATSGLPDASPFVAPGERASGRASAAAVRTVGVVGAGTMGNGIAHVFALAGREVRLVDDAPAALERARVTIGRNLERQARKGQLAEAPEA